MSTPSVAEVMQQMRDLRVLSGEQIAVVEREGLPRKFDAQGLLRELMTRGWLTSHKAQLLLQGRGQELAPMASIAPEPEILEYARPWKLALILGGVALVVLLIAILAKPPNKPRGELPDDTTPG